MIIMARNKKENFNPQPIFNHTINDITFSANQFVVPWQLVEMEKEKIDAKQLDLNFGK